jgi:CubicO group peptidase (beta-lactamase class C family)
MSDTRARVIDAMKQHGLGGAAVAIVRRGEPAELEYIGVADQLQRRAIDSNTVFRIASISKTMTSIGLMQLRDQGLFDLDDPVNKHLRTFRIEPPAGGADVTFRHLLTHTAGIGELPRVSDIGRRSSWGLGKPRTEPADLAAIYGGVLRPDVVAGSKWAYANHGFAVIGQLVEDLSGQPFGAYMHEHVFAPLGMDSTEYTRTDRTDGRVATGYHWMLGRFSSIKDYDLSILAPGSVLSSLPDMAIYAEWLLHGGAGLKTDVDVLRADTLAEMMSPQFSVHPGFPGMGLTFWLDRVGADDDEHRVAGHGGNVPGFASSLEVAPDDGIGVVVLVNTSSAVGAQVMARSVLRSLLGVADAAAAPPRDVADNVHIWSELVGHYAPEPGFLTNARVWEMFGGEAQVITRKRRLVIRSLSLLPELRRGLELRAVDESDPLRFEARIAGMVVPIAFERDTDASGMVDRVAIGPPGNVVLHRRSTLRSRRVRERIVLGAGAAVLLARLRRRRPTRRD